MRSWLLVALLLIPAVHAQSGALDVSVTEREFGFGPENWKSGMPEDEATRDRAGPWSASLGAYVDLQVQVKRSGVATPTGWSYVATLSDGETTVSGQVEVVASGQLSIRFDVDGQRPILGKSAIQPLGAGTWTLRVVASSQNNGADRPEGSGLTTLEVGEVAFEQYGFTARSGVAVPEDTLPHIREVGAGPNTWMPLAPVVSILPAIVSAPTGTDLFWSEWVATASSAAIAGGTSAPIPLLNVPDPATGTPLAGVDSAADLATSWQRIGGGVTTVDESGLSSYNVGQHVTQASLVVVTVHAPSAGGATSFVVPFAAPNHYIDTIAASEPGSEGPVQISASGPGARFGGGPLPATVYALSQSVPLTTGRDRGAEILSSGMLLPSGEDSWNGGYDGSTTRSAGVSSVAILAMFQDAFGNYAGHATAMRGLTVNLSAPQLGVGHAAALSVNVAHIQQGLGLDPTLILPTKIDANFGNAYIGNATIHVPSDGQISKKFPFTPRSAGSQAGLAVIDTGDLRFEVQHTFKVLDAKEFDDANAPWYDVPAPPGIWLLVALLALALRKREIRPPSRRE